MHDVNLHVADVDAVAVLDDHCIGFAGVRVIPMLVTSSAKYSEAPVRTANSRAAETKLAWIFVSVTWLILTPSAPAARKYRSTPRFGSMTMAAALCPQPIR